MRLTDKKSILKTKPFEVEEVLFETDDLKARKPYYRLSCPDWVNVLPITSSGHALLIRQPRVGSMTFVLETPGGVVDPGENDVTMAAARELEEETGFSSRRILSLGAMNPNPAIMNNLCHFFVAFDCLPVSQRKHFPDQDERIVLQPVPLATLEELVRTRQINHALSALCIMLAQKYLVAGAK